MNTTATAEKTLVSMNPASCQPVGEVPITPVEHLPQIVRDARNAQVGWAALTIQERTDLLVAAGPHGRDLRAAGTTSE